MLPRIRPMRLRLVRQPFDDPDFIFELKHDGFRGLLYVDRDYAWLVSRKGCVKKTRNRHAVRKMEVGPPEPSCRRRLQTAVSCFSQKLRWCTSTVKRRDVRSRHVWIREMSANEPLTKRRKDLDGFKTRVSPVSWEQHGRHLLTVHAGSGVQAA